MKKYIFVLQILLCSEIFAQCTFEKFSPFYSSISKVLLLKDGSYLTYGYGYVTNGEANLVLIKTDSCGKTIWMNDHGYLGAQPPYIFAVEMDSGNIMTVGYSSTAFTTRIGKYNKNGQLVKEQFLKKNRDDLIYGVEKNDKPGSYLLFGSSDYALPRALITEVDENLNIVRRREFKYSELAGEFSNLTPANIDFLIPLNNNQYNCMINVGTDNHNQGLMVELDSVLNIKKSIVLPADTLYMFGYSSLLLNKDKKHIDGTGHIQETEEDFPVSFFFRMNLDGNIQKTTYVNELTRTWNMSPTLDGGYITGLDLLKVDSNLNVEWRKQPKGLLFSVFQLTDSSYVCGGISMARNQPEGFEMYLVKMDQNGNYIQTGENEVGKQGFNTIKVYPNPSFNGLLTFESNNQLYQTITVYNTTGQPVFVSDTSNQTVDLSNQANGLYYIYIQDKEGNCLAKQAVLLQK